VNSLGDLKRLLEHEEGVRRMFDDLVSAVREALPGFGERLAVDGKAIPTHGRPRGEDRLVLEEDGRRDLDADFGRKRCDAGTPYERVKRWFGYKLHVIVDATYELPVAFEVTRADAQPELFEDCAYLLGDKGYEDTELTRLAWEDYSIKTIVPVREMWKDPSEGPRVFTPLARTHRDWATLYAKRTAVERVNGRVDVSFGFERHFIRGWKKMWLRTGLALVVMLAMALGRVKEKRRDLPRSLVEVA
jgi:hypothetical protein